MKSTVAISLQLLAASQLATGLTIPPLHQKGVKISEEAPQDIVTRSLLGEILPSPIDSSGDEIYGASLEKRKPPISSCCDRTPSGGGGTGPGGADDIALANRPVNSQNQGDQSQGSQSQGGVAALPPGVRGGDSITPVSIAYLRACLPTLTHTYVFLLPRTRNEAVPSKDWNLPWWPRRDNMGIGTKSNSPTYKLADHRLLLFNLGTRP